MALGKRILVYLANGVQGGAVARQALARAYRVRALVRDAAKSDPLAQHGVEIATGDLHNGAGLAAAHRDIDHIVLQMPPGPLPQIAAMMDNALTAVAAAGIKGVIVKLGAGKPALPSDVPSFALNQMIEDKVRAARIPFALVRPTMYLDNFLRPDACAAIAGDGVIVYPIATAQKLAWTTTDDTARAALTLIDNDVFCGDHVIAGPEAVDGAGLAQSFAAGLKRGIRFHGLSLDDFERGIDRAVGPGMGKRFSAIFRFIDAQPAEADRMLAQPFRPSPWLEGFAPTPIAAWVSEHAGSFA